MRGKPNDVARMDTIHLPGAMNARETQSTTTRARRWPSGFEQSWLSAPASRIEPRHRLRPGQLRTLVRPQDYSGAPPTRARQPSSRIHETAAAGLRAHGQTISIKDIAIYWAGFPSLVSSVLWRRSFPITAAGQLRNRSRTTAPDSLLIPLATADTAGAAIMLSFGVACQARSREPGKSVCWCHLVAV
jgi:hypothetical protein